MSVEQNESFYDNIDSVFSKLCDIYGLNKDLVDAKHELIDMFENMNRYNYNYGLLEKINKKRFKIDNDGIIKSC